MTRWAIRRWPGVGCLAVAVSLAGLVGCGGKPAVPNVKSANTAPTVSVPTASASTVTEAGDTPFPDDALHQPFAKATRSGDDPPAMCNRPPDTTITGKAVGKLYDDVVRLWTSVRFVNAAGKPLAYSVTLETDLGNIEIALRPDVAPNHVRNFIALAKAGYYDGLRFDRIHHEDAEDPQGKPLDLIEAGCPLGTGEPGYGSIGYWLKPEFDDKDKPKLPHEEGTIGACRGTEPDSAACKFYVTLSKAPYLDGNYTAFGKVIAGLDVARKIYQQPGVIFEADSDGSHRPMNPVVIRKVTVNVREAGETEGQH